MSSPSLGYRGARWWGEEDADPKDSWRPLSVRRGLRDDRVLTEGAPPRLAGPLERWLRPLLTAGVVEIVGLQLSLPLGSMYNPADALIQRCLMDQDLFLDVIDFTLRICAAQGLSASAGRLRLTLALAGSAWTVHSDDGALEQRVDPTYAAAAETAVEAGTTLGNSAGAQWPRPGEPPTDDTPIPAPHWRRRSRR